MAAQDAQPVHWNYPDFDNKNFELHGRSLFILLLVLLVFVLFFTILCIYLRWTCRFPGRWGPDGPGGGSGTSRPGRLSGRRLSPHGLDLKVISSLPVLLHRQQAAGDEGKVEGEDSMCSICLSVFVEGEKVKLLPKCRHTFHPECVDEWLKMQSSCPLCRSSIGQMPAIEVDDELV